MRNGKKRKVNSNQWSIKEAKINRNSGISYTSASKSKKKNMMRKNYVLPPAIGVNKNVLQKLIRLKGRIYLKNIGH